jgi:hypothetical protein
MSVMHGSECALVMMVSEIGILAAFDAAGDFRFDLPRQGDC